MFWQLPKVACRLVMVAGLQAGSKGQDRTAPGIWPAVNLRDITAKRCMLCDPSGGMSQKGF